MTETRIQLSAALNLEQLSILAARLTSAEGVLVLEGGERGAFCTGLDVVSATQNSAEDRTLGLRDFEASIVHLLTSENPAIALIDGDALGGGLGLAAACDLTIASPDARFGLPEPLFALIPGMITPVVRTRISAPNLRRMAISGESISAAEAHRIGLVDIVCERSDFDRVVAQWSRKFSRAHPPAIGRLKSWLAEMDDVVAEIKIGAAHLDELLADPEVQRRAERFRAGEIPWEQS